MNMLLLMAGYPPAIIRKRDRLAYIGTLEQAQLGGSKQAYNKIIVQAAERSLDIYLKALQGNSSQDDLDSEQLLKIGALAKAVGTTVPTIRYWTQEGLLEVAAITASGYHLYALDMQERCLQIIARKSARLSIAEIKEELGLAGRLT